MGLLVCASGSAAETIHLTVDPAAFSWVEAEPGSYRGVLQTGRRAGVPGTFDFPCVPVQVQPPAGARLASVSVISVSWRPLDPASGPVARFQPRSAGPGIEPNLPLLQQVPGGYRRGLALDGLVVSPVQPDGQGGYRLAVSLELELVFGPDTNTEVARPLRGASVFPLPARDGLRYTFGARTPELAPVPDRPQPFSPRHRPSLDGSPVAYVIVTPEAFKAALEPLATWRTQTGLPAVIRTMEWIDTAYTGVDQAERLRRFIRDAVTYWGTQYVLLAGDAGWLPIRYGTTTFYGGAEIPSDLYFQCLDGDWNANGNSAFGEAAAPGDKADIVADVWLGRAPVRSAEDAAVFVQKVLHYERGENPSLGSALILAEVLFPKDWVPNGGATYIDGATLGEYIASTLANGGYTTRKLYENHTAYAGAVPETLSTVVNELQAGAGVALHVGHGSYLSMSVGLGGKTLTRPLADDLTNAGDEFFLYSVNCTSAALDYDAIAKHFLLNPNGGAFGCVGSTRFDFPGASDPYDKSFFDNAITGGLTVGEALAAAKLVDLETAQVESADRWTTLTVTLLSDPAVRLWSATPQTFSVTHPAQAPQGSDLTVTVETDLAPVPGARVVVVEPQGLWASAITNAQGVAVVPLTTISTGEVTLSVVAPNFVPYQAAVEVTSQTLEGLPVVEGVHVNGEEGGCVLAGSHETVTWSLTNQGSFSLTGLQLAPQGALSFSYLSGPSTLAPGETGSFAYSVDVPESLEDLQTMPVTLAVSADQGSWSLPGPLHVSAPVLGVYELVQEEVSGNGNGIPEAGEEFLLYFFVINDGTGAALAHSLFVTPVQGVEVLSSPEAFSGIAPGEVPVSLGVRIRVQAEDPLLKVAYGTKTLKANLDLIPPAPVGVAGTSGGTHSIRLSWEPSPTPDVARYVLTSSETQTGPFTRISAWEQSRSSLYVDEPLPELSVRYYRIAAQDSSGNLSAFSDPIRATTGLAQESGFPLDCGAETGTSPVVADLDGDGRLELITGGDQIYVVHADGSELMDGDGDVRTTGPFTNADGEVGFFASPAVGDLDGDGRLEVAGVLAKEGLLYVWDGRGTVRPGWPVRVETFSGTAWVQSSPTLLDFDGDGDLEIALQAGEAVYVFHHDGREFADGDGNPSTVGVYFFTGARYSYTSLAAWDLDGDGAQELIVAARNGRVYILRGDGSSWPGFPLTFGGELTSSPAVADLDGDGAPEIIFGTGGQNSNGPDSVEVRRLDGSSLPGWPQSILMNQDISSSPAVADWDGDGKYEICMVSGNTTVYLWNGDGTPVSGFPHRFFDSLGNPMTARGSPAVANLDDDPEFEAAFTNQEGWLYGINMDGTLVEGFPIRHAGGIEGCPLIADINQDGFNELCVTGLDSRISLYRTPGTVSIRRGWPMFQGNALHTGSPLSLFDGRPMKRLGLVVLQTPHLPGEAEGYLTSTVDVTGMPVMRLDGNVIAVEETPGDPPLYRTGFSLSEGSHTLSVEAETVYGVGQAQKSFDVLVPPASPGWASVAGVDVYFEDPAPASQRLLVVRDAGPGSGVSAGAVNALLVGPSGETAPPGTRLRLPIPENWAHAAVQWWDGSAWVDARHVDADARLLTVVADRWGWFRVQERTRPVALIPVFNLGPPVPNPTTGVTRIRLELAHADQVRAVVYDLQGRVVRRVADAVFPAGTGELMWDGTDDLGLQTPAGVYFVRVRTSRDTAVRRVVRLRGQGRP